MLGQKLVMELQHEVISTTKMLERIPFDKFDWKPHEKSMSLGQLATHMADLVGYFGMLIDLDGVDMAAGKRERTKINSTDELVQLLKKNIDLAVEKLNAMSDDKIMDIWTLRNGDQVIFAIPRIAAIRSMAFSHLIHHRGQLSVYLRMLNIPVPSIYGPSADEIN